METEIKHEPDKIDLLDIKIQGIKINYAVVCERKLWLFSKGIQMEKESDRVALGKVIHEWFFREEEERKEIELGAIKIDILGELIKEVKLSDRMEEADKMQILYYLWCLKKLGVNKKGVIKYPKQKKVEFIELTEKFEREIESLINYVEKIESLKSPPPIQKKPYCRKCAYYELCWS